MAPLMHYASMEDTRSSLYGGRHMVVMDFFDGEPAVDSLTQRQFDQVSRAVALLHSQHIVFGDLREPNTLVNKNGDVMIIDFD